MQGGNHKYYHINQIKKLGNKYIHSQHSRITTNTTTIILITVIKGKKSLYFEINNIIIVAINTIFNYNIIIQYIFTGIDINCSNTISYDNNRINIILNIIVGENL